MYKKTMDKKTLIAAALAALVASTMSVSAQTSSDTTKKPSAAQSAARERMAKCAAEWKEAKAGGKVEKETTWPKYWSACNKRLKGARDA